MSVLTIDPAATDREEPAPAAALGALVADAILSVLIGVPPW